MYTKGKCEDCQGRGRLHILADRDATYIAQNGSKMEIQRCDTCQIFDTDEAALAEVVKQANFAPDLLEACKATLEHLEKAGLAKLNKITGNTSTFAYMLEQAIEKAEKGE